jgi:hypothetical protein
MMRFLITIIGVWVSSLLLAQSVAYTRQDSILVEKLLRKAATERGNESRMYYFGRQLEGVPYVAHTLEEGDTEHLIVNLHELDCLTFVETTAALSLCDSHNQRTFRDFCRYLQQLRYRNGRIDGYPSRLHYFTWWSEDNVQKNLMEAVENEAFTGVQTLHLNYMSKHPNAYKHLKQNPSFVPLIRKYEQQYDNTRWRYIPKSQLKASSKQLPVRTGDILSLITSKEGLDNTHVGIAFWRNGHLHLMHASSIKKRVILDLTTLFDYCQSQPANLGIRVYRMK